MSPVDIKPIVKDFITNRLIGFCQPIHHRQVNLILNVINRKIVLIQPIMIGCSIQIYPFVVIDKPQNILI